MRLMVSYTQPCGKAPLDAVWKRAGNGRWLDKPSVCWSTANWLGPIRSTNPMTGEAVGKSNCYQSQSGGERKHFYHREKPSASFFAFLSVKKYSPVLIELMLQQHPRWPVQELHGRFWPLTDTPKIRLQLPVEPPQETRTTLGACSNLLQLTIEILNSG